MINHKLRVYGFEGWPSIVRCFVWSDPTDYGFWLSPAQFVEIFGAELFNNLGSMREFYADNESQIEKIKAIGANPYYYYRK